MKRTSTITTLILIALLLAQSVLIADAQGQSKNPDPKFKDKASYVDQSHLPYYGKSAIVDTYIADGLVYSVDSATEDVVTIEPEVMEYQIDATYSEDQLREMAEVLIIDFFGQKIKLDKLSFSLGEKIGTFFFRWEDLKGQLEDGSYPFIQVGLSQNGDFLNLVNTLPFSKKLTAHNSNVHFMPVRAQELNLIGPFTEVYANGGSYWTPTTWSYSSATGGYYNSNSGCSGTFCSKYYYKTARSTALAYGRWTPNANTNTKASAFIPSNNATATVKYDITPNSGNTIFSTVDQNAYFNAWKSITSSTVTSGIYRVRLWDVGFNGTGTSSYYIAWDEVWVYNP